MNLFTGLYRLYQDWRREDEYQAELDANFDPLYKPDPQALRLYVLVDSTLPPLHQGIQAAHAVVELLRENAIGATSVYTKFHQWANEDKTLILLAATQEDMDDMIHWGNEEKIKHACFEESDLANRMTAIAFEPMTREEGRNFFVGFELAR
jgi:hypothetical protein